MTIDITELVQMKGQKVEGSYYLAECTDCGKMYPSNKLNGGEPLFSGDYGECYCPHCNADDAAIGDCGDTSAKAWNYQQNRIDALVEALEKVQRANAAQDDHINQQADRIESLEKKNGELGRRLYQYSMEPGEAERRIADLEDAEQKLCAANVTLDARAELAERQLESRTVKLPNSNDERFWGYGSEFEVKLYDSCVFYALTAAGIKWEAE